MKAEVPGAQCKTQGGPRLPVEQGGQIIQGFG